MMRRAARVCQGAAEERADQATNANRQERTETPITVAGCLQKGDGSAFLLTRVNEPTRSVGTTGPAGADSPTAGANSAVVEREQMRSAAGAYRLDPKGDVKLDDLVGKEVRVVGTVTENMDLPRATAGVTTVRTSVKATSPVSTRRLCQWWQGFVNGGRGLPHRPPHPTAAQRVRATARNVRCGARGKCASHAVSLFFSLPSKAATP
jgi:hypothetical protein